MKDNIEPYCRYYTHDTKITQKKNTQNTKLSKVMCCGYTVVIFLLSFCILSSYTVSLQLQPKRFTLP